jgi:CubicO group peptidase (beta-lactamase class C family)
VHSASGDPELARELDRCAGKRTRSVAAAVVDLAAESRVRLAFIDAHAETRFEIGSVTKGLTGMLLADAVDRGELSLDSTIAATFPQIDAPFGSVTARELCTHTSGLPRIAGGPRMTVRAVSSLLLGSDPYHGRDGAEVVQEAARQPSRHRGQYHYSNLGAAVLGQLLAAVGGADYRAHLRARILLPTGMNVSVVGAPNHTAPRGWSSRGRRQQPWIMDGYAPAGAVVSTVADMSRLAVSLLDGSAPGCRSLVAVAGVETETPHRASGMLWIIDSVPNADHTVIWHNGQTGGYSAFFALFPEVSRAVVVLANVARAAEPERIALALVRANRL